MRKQFAAFALVGLTACDFSCDVGPIDLFPTDYFGDGLVVHRPALELDGVFDVRAETSVRLYFAGVEERYADRAIYAVTSSLISQLELERVDDANFESDDAGYAENAQLSFLVDAGGDRHAGHMISPFAIEARFDVESGQVGPTDSRTYVELYRAGEKHAPELVYENVPNSAASMVKPNHQVPTQNYAMPGHYALVLYNFAYDFQKNSDPEWHLAAGTGSTFYFEVTE